MRKNETMITSGKTEGGILRPSGAVTFKTTATGTSKLNNNMFNELHM